LLLPKTNLDLGRWSDTLISREKHKVSESCIGRWLPAERLVELTQQRGKKHAMTGFIRGGLKLLHPEEAMYLLDEGSLYLLPFKTCTSSVCPAAVASCSFNAVVECAVVDNIHVEHVVSCSEEAATHASGIDEFTSPVCLASAEANPATVALFAVSGSLGSKRKREDSIKAQNSEYIPFKEAYELLLRHCNFHHSQVYSLLRSQGLLPIRHRKFTVEPGPGAPPVRLLLLPQPHEEALLEPVYDVYARDGITSFKPSAPGAPDFYVCIARCENLFYIDISYHYSEYTFWRVCVCVCVCVCLYFAVSAMLRRPQVRSTTCNGSFRSTQQQPDVAN
jgi:hypothetical protein